MNLPKIQNSGFSGAFMSSSNKYDPNRTTFGDDAQGEPVFFNEPLQQKLTPELQKQLFSQARSGKPGMTAAYLEYLLRTTADPIRNTVMRLQKDGHLTKCQPKG